MRDFKTINSWQKEHELVIEIYEIVKAFSKEEEYRLTSQLIRAVTSIQTNIAEGCRKDSLKDTVRYFNISIGSSNEVEYLLLLVKDLKFIPQDKYEDLNNKVIQIRKMPYKFA